MAVVQRSSKAKVEKSKVEEEKLIPLSFFRTIVETYYDFQHQRIITENRIFSNSKVNGITKEQLALYGVTRLFKNARQFEKDLITMMKKQLRKNDFYLDYLKEIVGIGPIISMGLLAYIEDIGKFDNISKLWQMSGFGMNRYCDNCKIPTHVIVEYTTKTGKKTKAKRLKPLDICTKCGKETKPIIQRGTPGYQSNWNPHLKTLCWKVGQSFQKQQEFKKDKKTINSYYRHLYLKIKAEEKRLHPTKEVINGKTFWNPGHLDNRALRKVIKIFLSHLWQEWRSLEGLEVTKPYASTILGHDALEPVRDRK